MDTLCSVETTNPLIVTECSLLTVLSYTSYGKGLCGCHFTFHPISHQWISCNSHTSPLLTVISKVRWQLPLPRALFQSIEVLIQGKWPFGSDKISTIVHSFECFLHGHLLGTIQQDPRKSHPAPPCRPTPGAGIQQRVHWRTSSLPAGELVTLVCWIQDLPLLVLLTLLEPYFVILLVEQRLTVDRSQAMERQEGKMGLVYTPGFSIGFAFWESGQTP